MSFVCLAYHRISAEPDARADPYTVTPARFSAQMAWLARAGYRGVPLGQAGQDARKIALTFDDGSADFIHAAWPVLCAHGFGATVFVVAGAVGGAANWPGAEGMPLMDWTQLKRLAAAGVELGAHAWHHHALDGLTGDAARSELCAARDALAAHLAQAPAGLAYPYGRWSVGAAEAAEAAGFAWACTARGGRNTAQTPRYKLRRTLILGRDGMLAFQLKVRTGYARLVEWRMDLRRLACLLA